MRHHGHSGMRQFRMLAVVLALVTGAGLSALGAKSEGVGTAKGRGKAREVMASLQALDAAVKKDAAHGPAAQPPPRPSETITPPTLTPAALDALVETELAATRVPLAPPTTDVEFVRRVYLDLTGKLPSPEQVVAFVQDREMGKRGQLIEHLLNSEDYARNWARYWRDVIKFHASTQNGNRVHYDALEDWLAAQIGGNRPWDEVARGLITAQGRDDENGAVNFALAHEAQAVEISGEVSRIFLGIQIQCAQCHDHPTDSWKRRQFHEFAAFFAGLKRRPVVKGGQGQRPVVELFTQGRPRYAMPDEHDPQKQIVVAPKFFLDAKAEPLPNGLTASDRLAMAASYVTGQDNPWFARAFVNRIWYALMGEGFYNPVDDMGPERTAKAPAVIEALATQWQRGGYDVRWLFRTILNSRAYQREVRSTDSAAGRTAFAAVCPSRLRSDQILEALAQALNLPLDGAGVVPANGRGGRLVKEAGLTKDLKEAVGKAKGQRRVGPRVQFNALFGVDPSTPSDEALGTIPQALFLMNSPMINGALRGPVLTQILAWTPNNHDALTILYLRVLARAPTPREVQTCNRYILSVGNRREAFEDIFWSLINSTEFLTRR